jgi:pyruvate dehydrogenase E2 component (dihydrolipoamide acetyltransferase)
LAPNGRSIRFCHEEGEIAWSHNKVRNQEGFILTTVIVPKSGGVTSTKACVVRWLKREGDAVNTGDPLVELETEKVSYELESPVAGVLLKVVARETAEVPVGEPLCHIGQPTDPIP